MDDQGAHRFAEKNTARVSFSGWRILSVLGGAISHAAEGLPRPLEQYRDYQGPSSTCRNGVQLAEPGRGSVISQVATPTYQLLPTSPSRLDPRDGCLTGYRSRKR